MVKSVPTKVIEYVHYLENHIKQLEKELVATRENVASLELYNNQLEYHNYLFGLLQATARPLAEEWRTYLADRLACKWKSKGFAEHVRRENYLRISHAIVYRDLTKE